MKLLIGLFVSFLSIATLVESQWFDGACGVSKYADAGDYDLPAGKKIVGGIEARSNEFPWQVSLRGSTTNSHFCGGIVINENWIITAAHCVDGSAAASILVVVGEHSRSDANNAARQILNAQTIIVHENYNDQTLDNDIAVVKTSVPIQLNENVVPACEPVPTNLYAHLKSEVSGWGSLTFQGSCCPDILQYTTVNITTNAECQAAYGPNNPITDGMICSTDNFGSNDRDSCQGDSGGPMTVKDGNGIFSLVGIVSWGFGCASGWPGVYARAGYYNAWVQDKLDNN